MDEQARLDKLAEYELLNTHPETKLNEITEIAALICDTPIAWITILDSSQQWLKAKIGFDIGKIARKDSFCQHALHTPDEVLVVPDAREDERFKNNAIVLGKPFVRFYAGAPLKTPEGLVIGSLCVLDTRPKEISERQKKGLQILAKKVMDYVSVRTLLTRQHEQIVFDAVKLKKLTEQVPDMIFQGQMSPEGKISFDFVSEGVSRINPSLDPESVRNTPEMLFDFVHPEDLPGLLLSLRESYEKVSFWSVDFRSVLRDGRVVWRSVRANPEKQPDGSVVWRGILMDVTKRVEYEKAIEQISFDISHVLRKPVASLLGLTALIEDEDLDEAKIREYSGYIRTVSEELDTFTRKLNQTYSQKREIIFGKSG